MCGTPIIGQVDANVAARGGVHERDRGPVDKADLGVGTCVSWHMVAIIS